MESQGGTLQYSEFLERKAQLAGMFGFDPVYMPEFLFDFQRSLVEWSLRKGRAAIFADCGLGKTPMQLVWAENVVRKTNRPVLILTPLAVSYQTQREAEKFGIDCRRCIDGKIDSGSHIVVTNYERIEHFDSAQFAGVVCDESSILKNFSGSRRKSITEFMKKLQYRLLCTATAAPNDYIELGTSSEALGELGHMGMLARFFKNDQNTSNMRMMRRHTAGKTGVWGSMQAGGDRGKWRFRGHAEIPFWKWVCSWARAVRRPSDLGFDDGRFVLPELIEREHVVKADRPPDGMLFDLPAVGLKEQRDERRRTIEARCERVAELVQGHEKSLVWCHLNDEGDLLSQIIGGSQQVAGSDSDDAKEERLMAFANNGLKVLVTKPKIGAWGLNLQKCNHITFFPSHSYEQYYQGVRRCWRFGQDRPVTVDVVTSEGEVRVMANLQRKAEQADRMFSNLVSHMNESIRIERMDRHNKTTEVPSWLLSSK